jgi:hypothetical protein
LPVVFGPALCRIARDQNFLQGAPNLKLYFVGYMLGNLPMHEFLIDCSFKQYSMALQFDLLIQCYAILILRYAACRGIMVQRYAA